MRENDRYFPAEFEYIYSVDKVYRPSDISRFFQYAPQDYDARSWINAVMEEPRQWLLDQGYDFQIVVAEIGKGYIIRYQFKNENHAVIFKTGFG